MSRQQLIAVLKRLSGNVTDSILAATEDITATGGDGPRIALCLHLAYQLDHPPIDAKLSEIASASKELRAALKELPIDGGSGGFFDDLDDLPTTVGH